MSMTCPVCDSSAVRVARIDVPAVEIGLPSGTLSNVAEIQCDDCGETSVELPSQGFVLREYRGQLARLARGLTSEEFAFLRRSLGVTGRGYAELLGVTNVTISRIEHGESVPPVQETLVRALTLFDLHTATALVTLGDRTAELVDVDVADIERQYPAPVVVQPVAEAIGAIRATMREWCDIKSHVPRGRVVSLTPVRASPTARFVATEPSMPLKMAVGCP